MRDSWRLVTLTSAAKIYWVLATLVTAVVTARYLGPVGRGILVAAVAWVTMFSTFGHLSLSQVVVFFAAGKPKEEWLRPVAGTLMAIIGSIAAIGWIVAGVLYAFWGERLFNHLAASTLLFAFLALPFMMWVENGNGIFMCVGRLDLLNTAQVAGGTAALVLTYLAVGPLHLGVNGAVAAFAVGQATAVAISIVYILRQTHGLTFDRTAMRELLTGSMKLHLNAIGTYLFTQANILILNHYRSSKETAWFQLALQLVTAIQIIPMAVSTVTYSLVSQHGPDDAWPQQRKLLLEVLGLVAALAVVGYFVAPFAVPKIFGASFLPSVPVFRILLLTVFGMTLSVVMASQWIGRGFFVQAAAITVIVGALTVVGNLLVVGRFGMYGAAWVTVGTYVISIIGNGAMALWVERRVAIRKAAYA